MATIVELDKLIESMSPEIQPGDYIFCTVDGLFSDYQHLDPLAFFKEPEGLTLIISCEAAKTANIRFESTFKQITLNVHSSLNAVGLTAAVSSKLASKGISANVVAAFYHDHLFVHSEKAEQALLALEELSATGR